MGIQEILLIAVVLLVLFGAKKIPEMMKGIGKGINEFNSEKNKPLEDDEPKDK
ncbi:MAG: twin-arginine translocase TatA/TatE family subunit [Parafilimonas sp.]